MIGGCNVLIGSVLQWHIYSLHPPQRALAVPEYDPSPEIYFENMKLKFTSGIPTVEKMTCLSALLCVVLVVAGGSVQGETGTCNATQKSDWSVGGELVDHIEGCLNFGVRFFSEVPTYLTHIARAAPASHTPASRCECSK